MFDKVKAAGLWGTLGVLALVVLKAIFPDLQVDETAGAEAIVAQVLTYLVPVVVGLVAAWWKRERAGYGAVTTVVTNANSAEQLTALHQADSSTTVYARPRTTLGGKPLSVDTELNEASQPTREDYGL